jgi:hypothetical protein
VAVRAIYPVVITVAFIGYLIAGPLGAIGRVRGVFLPCYLLSSFRRLGRFVGNPRVKAFVDGVTCRVRILAASHTQHSCIREQVSVCPRLLATDPEKMTRNAADVFAAGRSSGMHSHGTTGPVATLPDGPMPAPR